jgi:hypothetical protein
MGSLPVNPAHFAGRYALKSVAIFFFSVVVCKSDGHISNMLTITFGTRADSTVDPLTDRALALASEFMELTGNYYFDISCSAIGDSWFQVHSQTLSTLSSLFSGFPLSCDHVHNGFTTASWRFTGP